jgi:hypothetical protein
MFRENQALQSSEPRDSRLQDEQHFVAFLDFPPPPIMRFETGEQVGARDEPGVESGSSKGAGGLEIWSGHQYHGEFPL